MMLKLPKCQNKIKIKNQKIQGFKSIEIKKYINIYIYIYLYIILRNREIQQKEGLLSKE